MSSEEFSIRFSLDEYWSERYLKEKNQHFEWLDNYSSLKTLINTLLTEKDGKILMLGCGNSKLSEEMYLDGYKNICNIDRCGIVISQMFNRNIEKPEMSWEVMDCTKLTYESNTFDYLIDKCTLDTLLCSKNPFMMAAWTVNEVQRVLKPGGYFLCISFGSPKERMNHFQKPHLSFGIEYCPMIASFPTEEAMMEYFGNDNVDDPVYNVYVCCKLDDADAKFQKNWNAGAESDIKKDFVSS
jgi:ubiquinone/menaquinone biosynthesis C-methylase UbiE